MISIEKNIGQGVPPAEPVDLSLWREFQEGLSNMLDIPLYLYDSGGEMISNSSRESQLCKYIKSDRKGSELCRDVYSRAVAQVIEKGKIYVYKCHANQYIFAIPVFIDTNCAFAVVGGQTYLSGSEFRDFWEGTSGLGLDERMLLKLKGGLKTIPPKSVFTIPNIVANLSVPFLKGLYSRTSQKSMKNGNLDKNRLKGFYALEQVYRSIAPVLDREELYDTILSKSLELVDAERGSLMILDNKNKVLSVKASKGVERSIVDNLRVKIGEGISGSIAAKGVPVMVKNIESEVPSWKNRSRYKTKSFISIPLKLDTRVIGVINMSDKATGGSFSEEDLHMLISFANFASIALERGAYYSMSEELKTLSMTDHLTGLFNRRYFRERLFEEVERVKRHNECFSAFIIDIDNFKSFNDRYGHLAGDDILKGVARSIRDAVRSMDVVSRYGGEEFAVILPHTNKKDSSVIAERIRKGVEEFRPAVEGMNEWPTISLGVAEFPNDASNIDDLVNKADRAMYLAKRMGKNRVVVYER
ncbi:MAG: diguanylate cyclase [Deltaproteobacteria bacterium]|nr:diguanylate cyclase [Deltaproteobacteria bacterium]